MLCRLKGLLGHGEVSVEGEGRLSGRMGVGGTLAPVTAFSESSVLFAMHGCWACRNPMPRFQPSRCFLSLNFFSVLDLSGP